MSVNINTKIKDNVENIKNIAEKNAIKYIALFGSTSRNEDRDNSDIDLYVKFDFSKKDIGMFALYDIQKDLEQIFGKKVDIITKINDQVKHFIESDLITIYEK